MPESDPSRRIVVGMYSFKTTNPARLATFSERLGAARISQHEQDGARWIAMKDPDGNPFRVFGPRPT